jgi:hypothetical protein
MSEKIEQFWRDATAYDVARVMKGEAVSVRVRDREGEDWRDGEFLAGFYRGNCEELEWKDRDGVHWRFCQVYDPPEWYINKPDPGEGCRLLEKFPPEDLQPGDEAHDLHRRGEWSESQYARDGFRQQLENIWYRRRIANYPVIPDSSNSSEVPNSSRSRDTIPSGWRLLGKDEDRLASDAYWSLGAKDWIVIGDDRVAFANEFNKWHAIRQVVYYDHRELRVNGVYSVPSGQTIRITAKGFEVL